MTALLVLEDGTVLEGEAYGGTGTAVGELVFITSMTGYQEIVTDPSFAGQMITFTQPMIGNYGVEADASESNRPQARAVIVREGRNAAPAGAGGLLRLAGGSRCDRHPGAGHAHADAAPARRRHRARGRLLGWRRRCRGCWR